MHMCTVASGASAPIYTYTYTHTYMHIHMHMHICAHLEELLVLVDVEVVLGECAIERDVQCLHCEAFRCGREWRVEVFGCSGRLHLRGGGEGEAEPRQQAGWQLIGLQREVHHVREVAGRQQLSTARLGPGIATAHLAAAQLPRREPHLGRTGAALVPHVPAVQQELAVEQVRVDGELAPFR